jgi:hypothetical protein
MIRIVIGALLAAAINGPVDAQQRNRATGPVIFHAGIAWWNRRGPWRRSPWPTWAYLSERVVWLTSR